MAKTVVPNNDDAVQEEILRVALKLYKKHGPGNVTMDDVANASGRSRTSLYYYYKNRDEIFQAVMEKIAHDVAVEIRNAVTNADTLEDKIYVFCSTKLKTSEEWKKVLSAMWQSANPDEKPRHMQMAGTLHKKLMHHESNIINEIVSGAIAGGHVRHITPVEQDTLAFIISCGIRGIRNEVYEHADPHDIRSSVRMLAHMAISWLKG